MSSKKNSSRTGGSSGGSSSNIIDRHVARALQEQYIVDARQGSRRSSNVAPLGDGLYSIDTGTQVARNLPSPSRLPTRDGRPSAPPLPSISYSTPVRKKSSNGSATNATPDTIASTPPSTISDHRQNGISPMYERSELFNKQQKRSGRTPKSSPRSSPRSSSRNSHTNLATLDNDGFIVVDMDEDEALARRLDQEMRDAELAASLERAERAQNLARHQQAAAAFAVEGTDSFNSNGSPDRANTTSPVATRSTSCRDKAIHYSIRLLVFLVVAGASFFTFLFVFGGPNVVVDPNTWMPGWPDTDSGKVGEHNKWVVDMVDNGLHLVVLNNLDRESEWNSIFRESISEWDNGSPDAVTLQIKRVKNYDPDCKAVRRSMKVCNGNYGPTDWRGVNQIILQDDYIITSTARMNDYYLEGTNRAQKMYTMCHELGHGLGLGHFDENFYNKDLYNCMDYTERPENNMHPDESNFKVLEELYGSVSPAVSSSGKTVAVEEKLENNGTRQLKSHLSEEELFDKYAEHLLSDPMEVVDESGAFPDSRNGWRLLRRTESAVYHEKELPDGYAIRSAILLA